MGWERKRGKIEEFNRLLRGATDTSFVLSVGDASILPQVRYCITLDSDTRLPRDAARQLIGIITHPLNRPSFDPARRPRHRGLRHPPAPRQCHVHERCRLAVRAAVRGSHRASTRTRPPSPIPTRTCSARASSPGRACTTSTRSPRRSKIRFRKTRCCRTTCSKACMRASRSSRTSSSSMSIRRVCSRTRGASTGGFAATGRSCCGSSRSCRRATVIKRNSFPLISRWKILDNLRRSLVAPMLLALLVAGWTVLPGAHWVWTAPGAVGDGGAAPAAGRRRCWSGRAGRSRSRCSGATSGRTRRSRSRRLPSASRSSPTTPGTPRTRSC